MGSEGHLSLPTIDFSKSSLKPGTPEWDFTKSQVLKACEDCGCFVALFDKLSLETRQGMVSELKELFDLPRETKMKNVRKGAYSGYIGQLPNLQLYESLGLGDPSSLENIKSFSHMLWPDGKPSFSENVVLFSKPLLELEAIAKRVILESLGVEKYLDELNEWTNYNLRVMKYDEPQNVEKHQLGLAAHLDKNTITILHQLQGDGIEIEAKGGEWIKIKALPGSFIVIIGEAFHAWTNGRLQSAYHRVMMTGNQPRYSVGLFSGFNEEFSVKAPEELVDEEHPLLFKPFKIEELVKRLQSGAGRTSKYCLDDFRIV
ncbi:hypothetical protein K2173_024697 [Erythroxylum novogranatense]|uniref:2-oxoglutarate-dependent dioxygenase DAO n=1 Tax=Erythroxylum novogranatense TaxID=1862640 RepID=A0AAV8SW61_9ROSI|nr:hypothetical protein K2173_024697 [Erythroxylum novogranatense]